MSTQTSLNGYQHMKDSGKLTERQSEVYEYLDKYGPCTARELHLKLVEHEGLTVAAVEGPNYVKPRLTELRDVGLAKSIGKRECSVTGITVMVLKTS